MVNHQPMRGLRGLDLSLVDRLDAGAEFSAW